MAHEITERDSLFTVRQPAWHNLGTVLEEYPTAAEAKAIAHPWEPITEPLYRQVPVFVEHRHNGLCEQDCTIEQEPTITYEPVEGWQGNVRSDDGHLLGVTTDTYELVTNQEMYDIAEALESEANGDVMFETGGSLKGGSKVWLLLRLKEPVVIGGDQLTATIPYYALQNAHDGSGSFRGQATMTRIVCDNTSQMADMDARQRGTEFTFRHTASVKSRIEEAKIALAGWRESVEAYNALAEHLMSIKVDTFQTAEFVDQFIPDPIGDVVSDRVRNNIEDARQQWYGHLRSETCTTIENTAYGLLQASVEYLNHSRRANTAESRFKRAYLDRDRLTAHASKLALQVANA